MLVNGEKIDIIENENDKNIIFNEMINERSSRVKLCSDREAESGAKRYMKKLGAVGCREFLLKVMYYLPYDIRENILEAATKPWVRTPAHYFTYSAKRELTRRGID